mgnify:CR=1 FL=1
MTPTTEIRCLTNNTFRPNIQNGMARCNKTLQEYITKKGNVIKEVICDYGNGMVTKSELHPNKIINTMSDGKTIEYTRNIFGDVLVKEGNNATISNNPKLWDSLILNIFKGF